MHVYIKHVKYMFVMDDRLYYITCISVNMGIVLLLDYEHVYVIFIGLWH